MREVSRENKPPLSRLRSPAKPRRQVVLEERDEEDQNSIFDNGTYIVSVSTREYDNGLLHEGSWLEVQI
ncbi:hypothetical protein L484_021642 [Morus notabilis]|uniref:Uncharacterized protein n=1 Tax=Morus notabilis TaxID=981085 RepID=W9SEM7_9ROSA|nr:hypothetical protein L484_021642 [Morus notabilis]